MIMIKPYVTHIKKQIMIIIKPSPPSSLEKMGLTLWDRLLNNPVKINKVNVNYLLIRNHDTL